MTTSPTNGHAPPELLSFPCTIDIKAVGKQSIRFPAIVQAIISRHIDGTKLLKTTTRESREGKYLAVTCVIEADNRIQLDAIYRDLTDCPDVLIAL